MPISTTPIARERFSGADTADIDGRTVDGGGDLALAVATWYRHTNLGNGNTGTIDIESEIGHAIGFDYCDYLLQSIPSLPPAYRVEVIKRWPTRDTETAGTRTLLWSDDFEDLGLNEPLEGRVHDGGTWEREDTVVGQSGAAVVGDGEGRAMQPADPTKVGTVGIAVYRVTGLTLPDNLDVEIDVYAHSNDYGEVGAPVRMQDPATAPTDVERAVWSYWWRVQQSQSLPYKNFYQAAIDSRPTGGTAKTTEIGLGNTKVFETRVRDSAPGTIKIYFGGTPGGRDGTPEITFFDGQFGTRVNFNSGSTGLMFTVGGTGAENALRVGAIRIYSDTIVAGEDALEQAWTDAALRHDPTVETAYQWTATFTHTATVPQVRYDLWYVEAGSFRLMRSINETDFSHDVAHRHSLEIDDLDVLHCYVYDTEVKTFDLNTDVADQDGLTVPILTTGDPACDASDFGGVGTWMDLLEVTVYAGIPCEGPISDPWPFGPPPQPDPVPLTYIQVREKGAWRLVLVPTPAAPGPITGTVKTVQRPATGFQVRHNTVWRSPFPVMGDGLTFPPPDVPVPPFSDPCAELPPTDTTGVTLDPPPTTRIFGAFDCPATVLGTSGIFTNAIRALGFSSVTYDLPQAQSRGATLILAQGGYDKFRVGGVYSQAKMFAWIESFLPINAELEAFHAAGAGPLYGIQYADDVQVARLWPPTGLSNVQLHAIEAHWVAVYPWLTRLIIRARPEQFPGASFPGIIFTSQWAANYRVSPATFVARNESALASVGGGGIIWSANWLHGGTRTGGVCDSGFSRTWSGAGAEGACEMSVTNLNDTADAFIGSNPSTNLGIVGWMYDTLWMGRTGMLAALADERNRLAAL